MIYSNIAREIERKVLIQELERLDPSIEITTHTTRDILDMIEDIELNNNRKV